MFFIYKYYQDLLALDTGTSDVIEHLSSELDTNDIGPASEEPINVPKKWKGHREGSFIHKIIICQNYKSIVNVI